MTTTVPTLTNFERDLSDYLVGKTKAQIVAIADSCSDYGINTIEEFEDQFYYQTDSFRPDAEFAQYLSEEVSCDEIPDHIQGCIDWDVVWNSYYRFDFWSVCIDETTYYFFNS